MFSLYTHSINLPFKINFITETIPKEINRFDQELITKVKSNNREIIEKNKTEDVNTDKSYRRKIKKKQIEK